MFDCQACLQRCWRAVRAHGREAGFKHLLLELWMLLCAVVTHRCLQRCWVPFPQPGCAELGEWHWIHHGFCSVRKHRAGYTRAWLMLYLPAAKSWTREQSTLKSSGREQRLVFVYFGYFSGGCAAVGCGTVWAVPAVPGTAQCPGWRCRFYGSGDSLLSVITELLKNQRLEFVLLLTSASPAGSEHVWCGAGELSPVGRGVSLRSQGGTATCGTSGATRSRGAGNKQDLEWHQSLLFTSCGASPQAHLCLWILEDAQIQL